MSFTPEQIQQLLEELAPERVATRQGAKQMTLSYVEGYDVINTLNHIFGFDGWSHLVDTPELVERTEDDALIFGTTCTIIVDGVPHRDVGIGIADNPTKHEIEKAYKEAATDALKRAARALGNQFGNSLYDKNSPLHPPKPARASHGSTKKQVTGTAVRTSRVRKNPEPDNNRLAKSKSIFCESCGDGIYNLGKYTAEERAEFSLKQHGQILCYACSDAGEN